MKPEKDNLEPNISRLVKLTGKQDRPSQAFKDALIQDALQELTGSGADQVREGGHRIMTRKRVRLLSCAAAVLIVCALLVPLLTRPLSQSRVPPLASPAVNSEQQRVYDTGVEYELPSPVIRRRVPPPVGPAASRAPMPYDMAANEVPMRGPSPSTSQPTPTSGREKAYGPGPRPAFVGTPPPAHGGSRLPSGELADAKLLDNYGGTRPPNSEPVDAMFFENYGVNPFVDTEDDHLSTFAVDVDTASYAVARAYLQDGRLPPKASVRVEEFVNSFDYGYAPPVRDRFAVYMEAARWSLGPGRRHSYLLRVGLKAQEISATARKPAILTFVIDVSGSMARENRLGLVKQSLRLLVEQLRPSDQIGIAVYGSQGRRVLDHMGLQRKAYILSAIDALETEGSTNAEEGLRIGYDMARKAFRPGCINRVILCSDGVANVGRTGAEDILELIKDTADKGITLSALGFGMGNYNDVLLEKLGDKGDGHYAYIDTLPQARRLFVEDLVGTLQVVARDVKIQVDFNPAVVRSYRLVGYENRAVPDEKFRDDSQDGGEVGAGHTVTALYELKLWEDKRGTVATTYIRYRDADSQEVTEFKRSLRTKALQPEFAEASRPFRLAATVAEFAEILRQSYWAQDAELSDVLTQAQILSREFKRNADVIELVGLIAQARSLSPHE